MKMFIEDGDIITPFSEILACEIAGFTLCGYKIANGYRLGCDDDGRVVPELPQCIELNGIIYTLEEVVVEDNGFFNAEYV